MNDQVTVTKASEQDHPALETVWQEVYGDIVGPVSGFSDAPKDLYIGRVGQTPAFACIVNHYQVNVRGVAIKSAGVAAVGTAGQFRGTGVGTSAMRQVHTLAQKEGFPLATLYGFRDTFYRRLGYASCGWRWQVKTDVERMPRLPLELPVQNLEPADIENIRPCYEAFIRTFNGSVHRTDEQWVHRIGKSGQLVYAFGNPVEAYFWCKPHGFFVPLEVGEFAWSTARGYRSALSHMRAMAINKSSVEWCEPPSGPYFSLYHDERATYTRHRATMFAVIDPAAAFKPFGVNAQGSKGSLSLTLPSGKTTVCSQETATHLLLGEPGPDVLASQGLLEQDAHPELSTLFPQRPVCCMDFF